MSSATETIEGFVKSDYKYGFITDIEAESAPPGLNEDIIRFISHKKNEPAFMLEWRLKAYRHWLTMQPPTWPKVSYPPVDFQDIIYYSAPKKASVMARRVWMRWIPSYWKPMKSWAFRFTNAPNLPAWPWMLFLTVFQ